MASAYKDPRKRGGKRAYPTDADRSKGERSVEGERSIDDVLSELAAMLKDSGRLPTENGAGTGGGTATNGSVDATGPNGTAYGTYPNGARSQRGERRVKAPPIDAVSLDALDKGCILLPEWLKNLKDMPYAQGLIDKAVVGTGAMPKPGSADERAWFLIPWAVAGAVWLAGEAIEEDDEDARLVMPMIPILLPIILAERIVEAVREKFSSDDGERWVPVFIALAGLAAAGMATGSTAKKAWNKYS